MKVDGQKDEVLQQEPQQRVKANFDEFRRRFPLKAMNTLATKYRNDCVLLERDNGLLEIENPPAGDIRITNITESGDLDFDSGKYLWAVRDIDGVHALEICGKQIDVGGGSLKHSNLTAGKEAHGGGELWYWKDSNTVLVNAHSGRYGDRTPSGVEMAQALVSALRGCGFKAATTGIEEDTAALRAYPDPDAQLEFC